MSAPSPQSSSASRATSASNPLEPGHPGELYVYVECDDPHRARARRIKSAHPQVTSLYGRAPWTAAIALALVSLQLGAALSIELFALPWWIALAAAWLLGAFVCHALFVVIHEACHRLVLSSLGANRLLMLLANLPMMLPFAIPLGHFHMVHHRRQGQLGQDPDLPTPLELRLFDKNRLTRFLWHLLFPFLQLLRLDHHPDDALDIRSPWLWANITLQLSLSTLALLTLSAPTLIYLFASLYFIFALHPLSGRYLQEHFLLLDPEQETSSYYGPLNALSLNFGHHTEHHDFPAIPWHRLPQLRKLAPQDYQQRPHHRSWTRLWLRLFLDPDLRLAHRLARPPKA